MSKGDREGVDVFKALEEFSPHFSVVDEYPLVDIWNCDQSSLEINQGLKEEVFTRMKSSHKAKATRSAISANQLSTCASFFTGATIDFSSAASGLAITPILLADFKQEADALIVHTVVHNTNVIVN